MLHDTVRKALSVPCSKVAKLCLVTMAAYLARPDWKVSEFSDLIGSEAKTIRNALKELVGLKLVKVVGQTELNAYIYCMDLDTLSRMTQQEFDLKSRSDLAALSRRVQVSQTPGKKKPKPSKASS
mgnify:CR=1 FL=1